MLWLDESSITHTVMCQLQVLKDLKEMFGMLAMHIVHILVELKERLHKLLCVSSCTDKKLPYTLGTFVETKTDLTHSGATVQHVKVWKYFRDLSEYTLCTLGWNENVPNEQSYIMLILIQTASKE